MRPIKENYNNYDNVAIEYNNHYITYNVLNNKSNQLANYLTEKYKIKVEDLIGICLDRSEYMIISMLGILKSGAAYVPIDPNYPEDRISYILTDTKTKLIITNEANKQNLQSTLQRLPEHKIDLLVIDDKEIFALLDNYSFKVEETKVTPDNIAYITYTSGTTGKPKGIPTTYRAFTHKLEYLMQNHSIDSNFNILAKIPYTFDPSIREIFLSLLSYSKLFILSDEEYKDVDLVFQKSLKYQIDLMIFVPTHLKEFVDNCENYNQKIIDKLKLKFIYSCGEKLSPKLARKTHNLLPSLVLKNQYGPTEACLFTCEASINKDNNTDQIHVGKNIEGTSLYISDNQLNQVPIGSIGELYISGIGLARGYLNRPDLTSERFIANPFRAEEEYKLGINSRIYKTGDLVRMLPSGDIEYIGRSDFQVKIRGFRIELGEIENAITSYPGIEQSVVLVKDNEDNKYIVGYYVSKDRINEEEILLHLKSSLPDYMEPTGLVHLEKLPLTSNGKVDRKSLPEYDISNIDREYIAPRNDLEKTMTEIWGEILNLDPTSISVNDNFFRLGGNSILAIRLIGKVNKAIGKKVHISSIFKNNILSDLCKNIDCDKAENHIHKIQASETESSKASLSFAQERLWFLEKYEGGTNTYNIPIILEVNSGDECSYSEISEVVKKSVLKIIKRHEVLRSFIKEAEDGTGYQEVGYLSKDPLEIKEVIFNSEDELDQKLNEDANYIFDFTKEYPIKVSIYSACEKLYLSIVIHHIAFDGWSHDIFLKELNAYFEYYLRFASEDNEAKDPLDDIEVQYKDFALWQRNYLQGNVLNSQLDFWKKKLDGFETLNLITDKPRPKNVSYEGDNIEFEIDKETSNNLRNLAKRLGVSLYSVMLSAYYLFLRAYTNQDDLIIGTPLANRHYQDIQNTIGFFVNSLPVRIQIDDNERLEEYIKRVSNEISEINQNQDVPFERLVSELNIPKDTSRHPIFQNTFSIQNSADKKYDEQKEYLSEFSHHTKLTKIKFDFSVFVYDAQEKLKVHFVYSTDFFEKETIENYADTYTKIISQFCNMCSVINAANKTHFVSDVEVASRRQINFINKKLVNYKKIQNEQETLISLFEKQVGKNPDNIALEYDGHYISYKVLNQRANQLGSYLNQKYNIKPNNLVGICLERSEFQLISMLGIMKLGAAYIPIDPNYPDERISYILSDNKTKILITNKANAQRIHSLITQKLLNKIDLVAIDNEEISKIIESYSNKNLDCRVSPNNLAYVIYTSGTTGNPKGVIISQHGIVNSVIDSIKGRYVAHDSKTLQVATYAFDSSKLEFFPSIVAGGTLFILKEDDKRDLDQIYHFCTQKSISHIFLTTKLGEEFLSYDLEKTDLLSLTVAGEKLSKLECNKFHSLKIFNEYGPTENSVCTTRINVSKRNNIIPIGKPISGSYLYILSKNLQQIPIGGIGELYISGIGLARGYLNRPDLTSERFIANPFRTEEELRLGINSRIYKTGDLVRMLPSGDIEYIGRSDFQVKIRGFRIELGEIENAITSYPGIEQSVVLVKDNEDNKYIVGYYVSKDRINEEEILVHLKSMLPDYMVPTGLIYLEKLPLTSNGKVDKKSLPEYEISNIEREYIGPRNGLEKTMTEIWGEILNLNPTLISVNDNFFRLGGNSILAIRLIGKVNKALNFNASIKDLFQYPNLTEFCNKINDNHKKTVFPNMVIPSIKFDKIEDQNLSFAQERLWFLEKYEGGTSAYNIPIILEVNSGDECSNSEASEAAKKSVLKIIERHKVLRSFIKEAEDGTVYQEVRDLSKDQLEIKELTLNLEEELDEELAKDANYIFDFTKEYPVKSAIYSISEKLYLSIVIHHIAFDGWSHDIFLKELNTYFEYYLRFASEDNEAKDPLDAIEVQYKDFALWQRNYLQGNVLNSQLDFWKKKLDGFETLNLITDTPRPKNVSYEGDNIEFEIDKETSNNLRNLAKRLGVSLYSVMLSAYYLFLRAYTNQDDLIIGTPLANRHYQDTQNTIGFFVNGIALRLKMNSLEKLENFIKRVGLEVITAQENQDIPFEILLNELGVEKDTSRHPIFQVMFSLQNFGQDQTKYFTKYTGKVLNNVSKFDFSTFLSDRTDIIRGDFGYSTALYNADTIKKFIKTYIYILTQYSKSFSKESDLESILIGNITLLDEPDKHNFRDTRQPSVYEHHRKPNIVQLFETQAEISPDNVAIIYENDHVTFDELNKKANKLARYIDMQAKSNKTIIALALNRGIELAISIIASIKSGSIYLPLDPNYPSKRLEYMFEDSGAEIIITTNQNYKKFDWMQKLDNSRIIFINFEDIQSKIDNLDSNNLGKEIFLDENYYIIYTSGSTGKPKGVLGSYRNSFNIMTWHWHNLPYKPNDKFIQKTSINFVDHIVEFYSPLLKGFSLTISPNQETEAENTSAMIELIKRNQITRMILVPSLIKVIIASLNPQNSNLNLLLTGGEKIEATLAKQLYHIFPNLKLVNLYGSSEVSADALYYKLINNYVNNLSNELKLIPIGKPTLNTKSYIVNDDINLIPIGGIGELCISGEILSHGYLNRPDLTFEKFIANPFRTEEEYKQGINSRIYKTGDLVRMLPSGDIEYIGRADFQVKIRGFRIELGEIENAITSYPGIEQSVVLVKQNKDNKYIVGYYVSKDRINEEEILVHLKSMLPDYMVPTGLIYLEKLPLTPNGKVDRKSLPEYEISNIEREYIGPRNDLEKTMTEIWGEILNLDPISISINDNFFKLGGNSLKSVILHKKIQQIFNVNFNIREIFNNQTLVGLVSIIKAPRARPKTKKFILSNNFNDFEPYIYIESEKGKNYSKNIFLFPPASSGGETYLTNLATELKNYNLYLFNNYILYLKDRGEDYLGNDLIMRAADYYLEQIKQIQKEGTYLLGGFCLGGNIALLISSILKNVSKVILIDSLFDFKTVLDEVSLNRKFSAASNDTYLHNVSNSNANIIFFKMTKEITDDEKYSYHNRVYDNKSIMEIENRRIIYNYYSKITKYNFLDHYLNPNYFKTIMINAQHFSWMKNKALVQKISESFKDKNQ